MNVSDSRIEAVFFDLDDTLYDQLAPFRSSVEGLVPAEKTGELSYADLFRRVRHYSDRLWDRYAAGELTIEDVRIQRTILAFAEYGIAIDDERAEKIQERYLSEQRRLSLSPGAGELIAGLQREGLDVGIMTNGPVEHQMGKIRALGLDRMIPSDRIFISDALGIAKPDPQVFEHISRVTGHAPERCLYVGDAWENDVKGSTGAGWHAIWLSRRGLVPDSDHRPDLIIGDLRELLPLVPQRKQA